MLESTVNHKLDALVAEKVMGWAAVEYPGGDNHWRDDDGRQIPVAYWKPSVDLDNAWKIVEHMEQHRPNEFMLWTEHGQWGAEFDNAASRFAQTPPLAICYAALAALSVPEPARA